MPKISKLWLEPIQGYDPWKNAKGFHFDQKVASGVCKYFEDNFKHSTGEWSNKPFILERWQKKIVGHLFGWKRKDGTRRYRELFLYIPKKNGKTQLAAGLALIFMGADNEPGAEVYCASGDTEQAGIIFDAGSYMVEHNKKFKKAFTVRRGYRRISYPAKLSYWKVLSSNAKTKHGPNVHGLILDEIHIFENYELIETLRRGTISRRQPLTICLTTADYVRESPCNTMLANAKKIRDNSGADNPFYLPVIYEADPEKDDWTSEETWKKVNPNYGVSVKRDYFVAEVADAKQQPTRENSFKRLHLNMQTKQENRWMNMADWDLSGQKINIDDLKGKKCFGAFDLSSTNDITSFGLFFPEYPAILPWFWVPEATAKKRIEYEIWTKDGYIEVTKGKTIDDAAIRNKIIELKQVYDFNKIAYDSWGAARLAKVLGDDDGFEMIEFRQGYKSMNEPTKELEKLVINHGLVHFGNPVLRWMVSNANAVYDPAGNVKLSKPTKDSPLKVDGVIALVMAYGLSIASKTEEKSVYDLKEEDMAKVLKEMYGK